MAVSRTGGLARAGGLAALAAVMLWAAGLGWFIDDALRPPPPPPRQADAIVVLTGGAERIETALRLLEQGDGRLLLVSGVSQRITLDALIDRAGLEAGPLDGRVTLGRSATSTVGNAAETAAWARRFDVHALIVVTASYHMRRALMEIGRVLPGVRLIAYPVLPPALHAGGPRIIRLFAGEYTKWLLAGIGVGRWRG